MSGAESAASQQVAAVARAEARVPQELLERRLRHRSPIDPLDPQLAKRAERSNE